MSRNFMNFCHSIFIYWSIFFHLKTNRQSEIVNLKIERYICIFVNNQQSMAEFAANNNDSISTKLSLFFTFKDLYLYMSFNIIDFSDTTTCKQINKRKTINVWEDIQSI